jgi:protoporphyrinogen oxidase
MEHFANIIVGAGPAGLQLGYYFQKHNIEYVILERNSKAGSFFEKFPQTGTLISINKKHTGSSDPEFNLRHDWNSLLSDDDSPLRFTSYSDDYYPDRNDLYKYLNDFAEKYKLNILYDTSVE